MNAQAKNILVGIAIGFGSGVLAVNTISISLAANTESASSEQFSAVAMPADRFASNTNYCNAFTGAQGVGTDGVSAEFSSALGTAIQANGGDAKRTFSMIREKCATAA